MEQDPIYVTPRRRWMRWVLAFALVPVLLYGLLQTQAVRRWLVGQANQIMRDKLGLHVEIGGLEGNWITHFYLTQVVVRQNQDTLLTLDTLDLRWQPLRVWQRKIAVQLLRMVHPVVHVRQQVDGQWNVQALFMQASSDTFRVSATPSWDWQMEQVLISQGKAVLTFSAPDSQAWIHDFHLQASRG